MPKALIITVGGSDEPIVNAIKVYNKNGIDFIYFICSGGDSPASSSPTIDKEGKPILVKKEIKCPHCKEIVVEAHQRENILKQSGYKGRYEKIEINNPDNFEEVYKKTFECINKAKKDGCEIIADFTGGTKTMSSVLAIFSALDFKIKPSLTIGERRDINKTTSLSTPIILDIDSVRADFIFKITDELISRYLYFPALLLLEKTLQLGFKQEILEKITKKVLLCKVFYLWDSFEYEKACDNLRYYVDEFKREFAYLLKILERVKNTGYELVFDLISNAQRQGFNGFYDNAVARLYRALELFAQIRLKKFHNIDTSALEKSLDKLKNKEKWLLKKNEKGEIKIGLQDDYKLLLELEDPLGKIYAENENEFTDILKLRNNSKLAHGNLPIDENSWNKFFAFCKDFIEMGCKEIKVKPEYINLPNSF
ncbi:MAG: TIGR02710 family CRISPR-associated CARF protein [Candidatus Omnitrophica bacterium]|nr:TIGR02710 family CRISPR-associated CARF protein [Candidatus Omnitrophota bacterium]